MHGCVIHASLKDPRRILDVGCGTGVVSCILSQMFPSAQVYGVDLSEVPAANAKPKNVTFIQGVMPRMVYSDDTGIFAKASFDLVFSRLLAAGMCGWQDYIKTAANLVKPGGYV